MVTAFGHDFESQSSELTWKGWIKNYRQDDSYVISWDDRGVIMISKVAGED